MTESEKKFPEITFYCDEWKPKGALIEWGKFSDVVEGERHSKCGTWIIETCEWDDAPNDYVVYKVDSKWRKTADNLKEAKRKCEERLRVDMCNGDLEKAHDMMVECGYEPDDREFLMRIRQERNQRNA